MSVDADEEAIDARRTWIEACFASLSEPYIKVFGPMPSFREVGLVPALFARLSFIYRLVCWPLHLVFCCTVPDCRLPRWRRMRAHWASFIICCFWIGFFTTGMIWMITVVGGHQGSVFRILQAYSHSCLLSYD
ncbi:unnamed protein product [Protopolystoma xenopodis]|uniref:Uncharacterized protein n=1 Tax=Protopolystoma xenopodis TaxID=117903 RepID=A0A3S5BDF4_9PLAT|nr:unnamed protein product [Protopolystoma xenopodis]